MPLVMTVRPGDEFYVGDQPFAVTRIDAPRRVYVQKKGDDTVFELTDTRATEVLPGITMAVGLRTQPAMARITIEAPRNVLILRAENYVASANSKDKVRAN